VAQDARSRGRICRCPQATSTRVDPGARKIHRIQAWWSEPYEDDDDRTPFASTLDRLEREPPKTLEGILKFAGHLQPDDVKPWHLALLARASGVTQATKATLSAKPSFVVGSLHVKGALQLKGPLVVTGDLTVDGPIIDVIEKWLLLVVGGSLKAHAIASRQDLLVGGDCSVRDFIWGGEMHCPLIVRGKVKTPLVVWTDHRPNKLGDTSGVGEILDNRTRSTSSGTSTRSCSVIATSSRRRWSCDSSRESRTGRRHRPYAAASANRPCGPCRPRRRSAANAPRTSS
jgi:cytoskeletal protein CcmA (bactofilin family)